MLVRAVTQQTHRPQKRNKNTDFDPLFFSKKNGSNVAMLVRAATLQTHRPQKRNKNTDFDPLFFSTKTVTVHVPCFHASSTYSIRSPDATHISPAHPPATHLPEGDQHAPKPGQGGFEPPTPKHRSRIV